MPLRLVALGGIGAAYIAFSHWLMTAAPPSAWNAVGLLGPMLAAAAIGCWRAGQRLRAGAAALMLVALVGQAATGRQVPQALLYLGQHVVIHLLLALGFASTLREGETPLISVLAARVHGHVSASVDAYTRHVTCAWVVYFVAMALVSLVLFAAAPFEVWAVFANLLTPLGVAAMLLGERLLRYRLHPEAPRAGVLDAVRAYLEVDAERQARADPASAARARGARR